MKKGFRNDLYIFLDRSGSLRRSEVMKCRSLRFVRYFLKDLYTFLERQNDFFTIMRFVRAFMMGTTINITIFFF